MNSGKPLVPPILVWEPNNLDVFSSAESVCRYLEPEDVVDDKPEAYDSEGGKVVFRVEKEPVRLFGVSVWCRRKVAIADVQAESRHANALRAALTTALGLEESTPEDLAELVRAAIEKFGVS